MHCVLQEIESKHWCGEERVRESRKARERNKGGFFFFFGWGVGFQKLSNHVLMVGTGIGLLLFYLFI